MTAKHSKYGFSSRERWSACPVSVTLSQGLPNKSSPFAQEGTIAHSVAEHYLDQWHTPTPEDYSDVEPPAGTGTKPEDAPEWNDALRSNAKAFVAYAKTLLPDPSRVKVFTESKLDVVDISPHLAGTADCIIYDADEAHLLVADYKYGFKNVGIGTEAHTNPQIAGYAYAALRAMSKFVVKKLTLVVYQPNRIGGDPAEYLVIDDPYAWADREEKKLRRDVFRIEKDPGDPNPGDHCTYCPAKGVCPVTHDTLQTALNVHSGLQNLLDIPEDQLIELFAARSVFKAFLEDVEERVKLLAQDGHKRLAIKQTAGRRMWANPRQVVDAFVGLGRTECLKPPSLKDAEAHLPADVIESLVKLSAPGTSVKVVDPAKPSELSEMFKKYVKST